jgi:hypothetical protein
MIDFRGAAERPTIHREGAFAMTIRPVVLGLALLATAPASGEAAGNPALPPTRSRALVAWLQAGTYRSWTPEPAVRPSVTAHGQNVRTWLNPILVDDLRSGRPTFRKGAALVKELYFAGQEEVVGFSVMRKVRKRSGRSGRGWYFFETFDGATPIVRPGRGVSVCVGCHRDGQDFYLLGFRP